MGGSEHTVPTQARVIIFALPLPDTQLTSTLGAGYKIVCGDITFFIFTS